jgi:ATP-dependent helicase HrpB
LLDRLRFLAGALPELGLPDWSADLHELIPELCLGRRSLSELRGLDLSRELLGRLTYAQREALDREAPASLTVPSGAQASIDYSQRPPVLSARVQQLFGMKETPRIAQGRVALMVHLTAPNNRPVQVTRDLSSFWANTYAEVRKDLRGRYPRHAWPEDPTTAIPENRPARRPR